MFNEYYLAKWGINVLLFFRLHMVQINKDLGKAGLRNVNKPRVSRRMTPMQPGFNNDNEWRTLCSIY